MNFKKLKDILFINGFTYEEVTKTLNISTTTFSNKINGKVDFTLTEIRKLTQNFNLTDEQLKDIFF